MALARVGLRHAPLPAAALATLLCCPKKFSEKEIFSLKRKSFSEKESNKVSLSYQRPSGCIFPCKHHVIGRSMVPSR